MRGVGEHEHLVSRSRAQTGWTHWLLVLRNVTATSIWTSEEPSFFLPERDVLRERSNMIGQYLVQVSREILFYNPFNVRVECSTIHELIHAN